MSGTTFRRAAQIGVRRVGDEIFILAPDGDLIVLGNETAVFMWDTVEAGAATLAALVEALVDAYDVPPEQANLDAGEFVRTLTERTVLLANGQ